LCSEILPKSRKILQIKNCLENYWTLGVLAEQGKPATFAAVETPVFKVFLWIIIVPQHDVISLRLPPCLCAVLKTVDVLLNLSR